MTDTEEIKSRIDIVDFIGEFVPLKRAGTNWKGLCPFHREKSPSFMAHRERQMWHCFGCNEGGDAFSFLMKMEGFEFPEALKILAERAGVKLSRERSSEVSKSERNRQSEILRLAARFYHKILTDSPKAEEARAYLQGRGLSARAMDDFEIGYAPDAWDTMWVFLTKRGYGANDVSATGLVVRNDRGGFYDRFRDRIMFPIADHHGNAVGFTGRLLHEEKPDSGGKYVNTPQTKLYDKGRVLYGLSAAKRAIKDADAATVVEGQMDVIACHEAGFANTVAASGTAFTRDQVLLLKRYTQNLLFAFDADVAGESASKRSIDMTIEEGMSVKVIRIPEGAGKDPDECIRKDRTAWQKAVAEAKPVMEYYFAVMPRGVDLASPDGKRRVAEKLLAEIARLPSAVEQDYWVRKLSYLLDATEGALREDLQKVRRRSSPHPHLLPRGEGTVSDSRPPKTRHEMLSERFLGLIAAYPEFRAGLRDFNPQALAPAVKTVYTAMQKSEVGSQRSEDPQLAAFALLGETEFGTMTPDERSRELSQIVHALVSEQLATERRALAADIASAEARGDSAKARELLRAFEALVHSFNAEEKQN